MKIEVTERQMYLLRRVVWNETVNFEQKALHETPTQTDWKNKGMEYRKIDHLLAKIQFDEAEKFRKERS